MSRLKTLYLPAAKVIRKLWRFLFFVWFLVAFADHPHPRNDFMSYFHYFVHLVFAWKCNRNWLRKKVNQYRACSAPVGTKTRALECVDSVRSKSRKANLQHKNQDLEWNVLMFGQSPSRIHALDITKSAFVSSKRCPLQQPIRVK